MTTALVILVLWVLLSVPLALLVARLLHRSDPDDRHGADPGRRGDQRLRDLFSQGRRR